MVSVSTTLKATALFAASVLAVPETVDLSYTKYVGESLPSGISQWLGMRFAAPPIGDLRFAPPQDPPHTGKTEDAKTVSCAIGKEKSTRLLTNVLNSMASLA